MGAGRRIEPPGGEAVSQFEDKWFVGGDADFERRVVEAIRLGFLNIQVGMRIPGGDDRAGQAGEAVGPVSRAAPQRHGQDAGSEDFQRQEEAWWAAQEAIGATRPGHHIEVSVPCGVWVLRIDWIEEQPGLRNIRATTIGRRRHGEEGGGGGRQGQREVGGGGAEKVAAPFRRFGHEEETRQEVGPWGGKSIALTDTPGWDALLGGAVWDGDD